MIQKNKEGVNMKLLNNKKSLGKSLIYFLIFFLIQPGFSEETQLLAVEAQEFICINNTSSIESERICLNDKITVERVAVCSLYTSTHVAEALCLKNKALSYEQVLQCYIGTDKLIEQICLIGSEVSSRILSQFEATDEDSSVIIKEIENIKTEMEITFDGYKLKFDITEGRFNFNVLPNSGDIPQVFGI